MAPDVIIAIPKKNPWDRDMQTWVFFSLGTMMQSFPKQLVFVLLQNSYLKKNRSWVFSLIECLKLEKKSVFFHLFQQFMAGVHKTNQRSKNKTNWLSEDHICNGISLQWTTGLKALFPFRENLPSEHIARCRHAHSACKCSAIQPCMCLCPRDYFYSPWSAYGG